MYAVTDIETTGLDPWRNEILSICTIIADEDFNEQFRFSRKIKPEYKEFWSEEAEKVHKFSWDVAQGFDNSSDVLNDYTEFLYSVHREPLSFVCHARPVKSRVDLFDRNFIFAWMWGHGARVAYYDRFPEDRMYSTILAKRTEATKRWSLTSQKLATWMEFLEIEASNHHDADFDAEVCLKILKFQKEFDGQL